MFDNYYTQLPKTSKEEKQNDKPEQKPAEDIPRPHGYDVSIGKLRSS